MSELNRNQIIKGLECCTTIDACKRCPYYNKPTCGFLLRKKALSLIYELAEENKRLQEKADRHLDNLKAVLEERSENTIVTDTVNRMVEWLKERIHSKFSYSGWYVKDIIIKRAAEEIIKEVKCEKEEVQDNS